MVRLLGLLLVIVCCGTTTSANSASATTYFDLSFSIVRDGKPVAEPASIVEAGVPARVIVETGHGTGGYRLDYEAQTAITESGIATAMISMKLFEQADGKWVLLAEPAMQTLLDGTAGKLTLDGSGDKSPTIEIGVSAKLVSYSSLIERLGGKVPDAQSCAELGSVGAPLNAPSSACCAGVCRPPPGNMSCCGALSCCACGVYCQVL